MSTLLCHYIENKGNYHCEWCGDETTVATLKRVCPALRPNTKASGPDTKWAYGITTVPSRVENGLLKQTIESLAEAGFNEPRLFCDGQSGNPFNLPMTVRDPPVKAFASWMLAAWELYTRSPHADRFAIFQDDCIVTKRLRRYLENCTYPSKGYWNLFTFPGNVISTKGWYRARKRGYGAVGLVFDNETLRRLISSKYMADRILNLRRGRTNIDGGIFTALKQIGIREYVHNPSLLQHMGEESTMGHRYGEIAKTFKPSGLIDTEVGLVGYNCHCGVGILNRQIATYSKIYSWLVPPHRQFETLPPLHTGIDTKMCRTGVAVTGFLRDKDTVLFIEKPMYKDLVKRASKAGVKTMCIPMHEWLPKNGWVKQVDMFICPTKLCYDVAQEDGLPSKLFEWPVDTRTFQYRQRETCERFLFLNAVGGYHGRKGSNVVKKALEIWPEFPITILSKNTDSWPESADVQPFSKSHQSLYDKCDVLVVPHKVDGLCLPPLEAAACGVPSVITDGCHWEHLPAIARIKATTTVKTLSRSVRWHEPSAEHLVEICKSLLHQDISGESQNVRQYAEENSWEKKSKEFQTILDS